MGTQKIDFWDNTMPIPECGCFIFLGSHYYYGRVWRNNKWISAHRYAYELINGPIPDGLFVLHFCDTGLCVNPDHLFLGTQADNIADCISKGRRNTSNNAKKLSNLEVLQIRKLYKRGGTSLRKLGKQYEVHHRTIHFIVQNITWRNL